MIFFAKLAFLRELSFLNQRGLGETEKSAKNPSLSVTRNDFKLKLMDVRLFGLLDVSTTVES